MAVLAFLIPAGTSQHICAVNGFHGILHLYAYRQHRIGSCQYIFNASDQRHATGGAGCLHPDAGLEFQPLVDHRDESCKMSLFIKT